MLIYLVKDNKIFKYVIIDISKEFERNSIRYKEYTYFDSFVKKSIIIPIVSNYAIDEIDEQIVYYYLSYKNAKRLIKKTSIISKIKNYLISLL